MTELQQNRYDKLLRRVGGMIGAKSMVNDALGELFPTIDTESLLMELAYLADTKHGISTVQQVASVGDLNHHQLFNPADSGMLVILTRVDVQCATVQLIEFDTTATALADLTANHKLRDTRDGIIAQPVAQARGVQQVGGLPLVGGFITEVNVNLTIEETNGLFVLAPGTGVTFATTTANVDSTVMFWWRERVAQTSELQF